MAFPSIAGTPALTQLTSANPGAVTLPSGIIAGELLLVFCAGDSSGTFTESGGSSWTLIDEGDNGTAVHGGIFAKIAEGGDTLSVQFEANDFAAVAIRVQNHGVSNVATDITKGTAATGADQYPNPPNCNPGVAKDYLWLEHFAADDDDNAATYWSSGWTGIGQAESAQSTSSCMSAVAGVQANAASGDPAVMAMSAIEEWRAQTIAIPPSNNVALTADPITLGAPVLGTPALSQDHALSSSALTIGAPVLATPALSQDHVLTAVGLTLGAPELGTPALSVQENYALAADPITLGAPILGTPSIGQNHALTADALLVGAPVLGAPALGQVHALLAEALLIGTPVLGSPALSQDHALIAEGLLLGVPVLGSPALAQVHLLSADGLLIGAPVLGTPILAEETGNHSLIADPLLIGAPVLDSPALAQIHAFIADGLLIGAPILGNPELILALPPQVLAGESQIVRILSGESHVARNLVGGSPVVRQLIGESVVE